MKKIIYSVILLCSAAVLFDSCVATKKYTASQNQVQQLLTDSVALANQVNSLQGNVSDLNNQVKQLKQQLSELNDQNALLMSKTNTTQSQLNQSQQQIASLMMKNIVCNCTDFIPE